MSNTLLILAFAGDDSLRWPWALVVDGEITATGSHMDAPHADQRVLIIPGQDVRIVPHDLPKLRKSEQMHALAFAIEDQVASDMAEQHLAVGAEGDKRVAVIIRSTMQSWLHTAQAKGFEPDHLVADFELLAEGESLSMADRVVIGGPLGHTMDPDWAQPGAATQTSDEAMSRFSAGLGGQYINLRQGEFALKGKADIPVRRWAALAASIILLGACWLGYQMAETRALHKRAAAIQEQAGRLVAKATGKAIPANPALAALRAQNAAGEGGGDFFRLSNALFSAVQSVPGAQVQEMNFNVDKGTLNFVLSLADFADAQKLETALEQSGLRYTPGGVREIGEKSLAAEGVLSMETGQ